MINLKNKPNHPENTKQRLRQVFFLAAACGGLSSAHATIEDSGLFVKIVASCVNLSIENKYEDKVLDRVRGKEYPSPKTGGFTIISKELTGRLDALEDVGCLVKGKINPTSPDGEDPAVKDKKNSKVPDINFQLYVPAQWNGKLVQFGGGLFSWPVNVMGNKSTDTENYALLMSDAGNTDPLNPSSPNMNGLGMSGLVKVAKEIGDIPKQELARNFGRDSIKKSLDVGVLLAEKLAGKVPNAKYFVGFSTGGRQAFKAIENWPDAYDGIVSGSPSVYLTRMIKRASGAFRGDYDGVLENLVDAVLGGVLGTKSWADPKVTKGFSQLMSIVSWDIGVTAISSGANYNAIGSLMDAMAPVWNVKPSTVGDFLNTPTDSNKKKKRVILYQGTQDIVVPCTQTGKFVRDSTDHVLSKYDQKTADKIGNSARVFFIKDYTHFGYGLKGGDMSWNYISALDRWVHDDKAEVGAPRDAYNSAGNIPSEDDLKKWGCAPSDFQ